MNQKFCGLGTKEPVPVGWTVPCRTGVCGRSPRRAWPWGGYIRLPNGCNRHGIAALMPRIGVPYRPQSGGRRPFMPDHHSSRRALIAGAGALAALAAMPSARAQSISLNFNFGTPGYYIGFWAPSPYYRQYYSPSLYAQYIMWYYYPSRYYTHYYSPPPPPPPGCPRPPRPPYGAPLPPPPDRFFSGLRVARPPRYAGAPHPRPGGPVPHWREPFTPPGHPGGYHPGRPGPGGVPRVARRAGRRCIVTDRKVMARTVDPGRVARNGQGRNLMVSLVDRRCAVMGRRVMDRTMGLARVRAEDQVSTRKHGLPAGPPTTWAGACWQEPAIMR